MTVPFIGESVEYAGKIYTVTDRKACGVAGWWLTLRTDNGQEFGVLDRSVKRVSPPVIDNVIPMPRRWVPRVIQGGLSHG